MSILNETADDFERAEALVNLLIDRATGSMPPEDEFIEVRHYFVKHDALSMFLPRWFPAKRSLNQFWHYIKNKYSTYAERRQFLWKEFEPLLQHAENGGELPAAVEIEAELQTFKSDEVTHSWRRMVRRAVDDPEGAITAARNLLETVLKHILDVRGVCYNHDSVELPELYKTVQRELQLAPEQHQEQVFKQILGGCSGVVSGLGTLRNKLGDAHGKGSQRVRPTARHARLAVNLAGSMALFLAETHHSKFKTGGH